MIKLEVDDICQNCSCFEPVTTVTELYVNDKKTCTFTIKCANQSLCRMLKDIISEATKNDESKTSV